MKKTNLLISLFLAVGLVAFMPDIANAQSAGDIGQIQNFIRNVIQALAGLAGLIATGFFVLLCYF
jgi:hypothetical protein